MKINKEDIKTLNMVRFGSIDDPQIRAGSAWIEIEGITGIAMMSAKAFLFNHDLGQAWVPKLAVKFEMKINCDPVEPEYRVYIASWFNWTEKIELMKQGKVVSDEYLARKQKETEQRFRSYQSPTYEEIFGNNIPVPVAPPIGEYKKNKGIDFKKINNKNKLKKKIREANKEFKDVYGKYQKKIKNKTWSDDPVILIAVQKVANEFFEALGKYSEAGYNLNSDELDSYEQLDELLAKIKDKIKKTGEKSSSDPGNRAIDL